MRFNDNRDQAYDNNTVNTISTCCCHHCTGSARVMSNNDNDSNIDMDKDCNKALTTKTKIIDFNHSIPATTVNTRTENDNNRL